MRYVHSFAADMLGLHYSYFFFYKQNTPYEMRISDWSSDVCSSDLSEVVPHATAEVDTRSRLPVLIAPGEICVFSGQHAHASVVNRSDFTRFSIDMRTISIGDVQTGRGAPNIDGAAPWIAYRLFKRCGDRMPLGDILGCGDFVPRLHSVPASS